MILKRRLRVHRIIGTLLICLIFYGSSFAGGFDDKVSKNIERTFKVPDSRNLSVTNKYGPIIINNWDKDSIRIEIELTAYGKNYNAARKTMNRVDFDFDESRQYLNISTVLDRSSGFFTEVWNSIGDYSKTLLSQNRLKVEYKVFIPNDLELTLINKYGDIYFEDYEGNCNIDLSYGNLMAQRFFNRCDIKVGYGTITIKEIKDGYLDIKASDVRIEKIRSAEINSSSSEIEIIEASLLRIESSNDREYKIRQAESILGKSSFSRIEVGRISDDINLDMSYGGITLNELDPSASRILLRAKTTDIQLKLDPTLPLKYRIEGREDKMELPEQILNQGELFNSDGDKNVRIEGQIKDPPNNSRNLDIRNQNGEIKISFT